MGAASFLAIGVSLIHFDSYCRLSDHQIDKLLIFSGIGVILGIATQRKIPSHKANYLFQVILRICAGYWAFQTIYYAFIFKEIPNIDFIAMYDKSLIDISPQEMSNWVNRTSSPMNHFRGYLGIIGLLALTTFRFSSLGFLILLASYGFSLATNLDPECSMPITKLLLIIVFSGLLIDLPRLIQIWNNRKSPTVLIQHPYLKNNHLYHVLTALKYFILIGLLVNSYNQPNRYWKYYANNADSPIKGVWTIKDFQVKDNSKDKDYQTDTLVRAEKLYLSSSRYGKIKVNDTLTTFEYMVDPSNQQFELWNFYDFRMLDLKGKFHRISQDSIQFKGKNAKDDIQFTMVLEEGYPVK